MRCYGSEGGRGWGQPGVVVLLEADLLSRGMNRSYTSVPSTAWATFIADKYEIKDLKKKISTTGINRTSDDGYHALLETQHDIDVLIRDFDQSENPGGRTLSAVCSRAIEELKLATSNNSVEIFSLNRQSEYYINPLVAVEETVYKSMRKYRFSTVNIALLMHRFPLLIPDNKLPLPRWSSEAAFIIEFKSKKPSSFSRHDVLSTIRNDIGAHFVTDITSRYHLLSQEHKGFKLSGYSIGGGSPNLEGYLNRPVSFYNSPLPYIIRSIAAEIQATIYNVLHKIKYNKKPSEDTEEDLGKVLMTGRTRNIIDKPLDTEISAMERFHKNKGVPLRE